MKRHEVTYQAGESRTRPGEGIDYMLVTVGDVELYAEAEPVGGSETGTYDDLRAAILDQAAEHGIDAKTLHFYYDGQAD